VRDVCAGSSRVSLGLSNCTRTSRQVGDGLRSKVWVSTNECEIGP
jgi:hypothetical protein